MSEVIRDRQEVARPPIITVAQSFDGLRLAWAECMQGDPEATYFSSLDWLETWWRCMGRGGTLYCLLAWWERRLVAAGALSLSGSFPAVLGFVGSPESDYGDFVVDERIWPRRTAVWSLLDHAASALPRAVFHLEQLPERSGASDAVTSWAKTRNRTVRRDGRVSCHYYELPNSVTSYERSLPKRMLVAERRLLRRLAERGQVRFCDKLYGEATWADVRQELAEIDHRRDRNRSVQVWGGESGRWLGEAVRRAAASHALWMLALRVDKQIVAYFLGFEHRGVLYAYTQSYDEGYSQQAPGFLLSLHTHRLAITHGLSLYDHLRGDEPYKRQWMTGSSVNSSLLLIPRTFVPSRACLFAIFWVRKSWRWEARRMRSLVQRRLREVSLAK